jgi:signal transduction histidine kinase
MTDFHAVVRELIANVSLDLRTPLALLLDPAERLLRDPTLSDTQRAEVERIARNARSLREQLDAQLDAGKLETTALAGRRPSAEHVNVSRLLRLVAGHFDTAAATRSITYLVDAPPALLASIDSEKLERAVFCLLADAFDETPAGGGVSCSVREDPIDTLRIEIRDSREACAVARPGTRLRLAIARDLALLCHGALHDDVPAEHGARFVLELPMRASAPAPQPDAPRPTHDDDLDSREHELETALLSLDLAREHAESTSRFKGELLGLVSHELRTPIASLHLQLERLRRASEPWPSVDRDVLQRALSSTSRLSQLVDSLLGYARWQAGSLHVERETCDLDAIAREAIEQAAPQAESKHLPLRLCEHAVLPALSSDPELLRVIAVNLLVNAIKFSDAGNHDGIEVQLEDLGHRQRLSVIDHGRGIGEGDQARIFEAFERVTPGRHGDGEGFGLGLSLVRELSHALGGEVEVLSTLGVGSTFRVSIPYAG